MTPMDRFLPATLPLLLLLLPLLLLLLLALASFVGEGGSGGGDGEVEGSIALRGDAPDRGDCGVGISR